ncbi:hypothetical protein LWI29_017891 [Acer saccharum]|uniref:MULE transposase domain-containing protein n=1 Tax=Acer saccharum TaxID=4024 RepID=A0AA39SVV4_ACESA|nr:hypothetical protein LWI29_017891 [Acer saccharum]
MVTRTSKMEEDRPNQGEQRAQKAVSPRTWNLAVEMTKVIEKGVALGALSNANRDTQPPSTGSGEQWNLDDEVTKIIETEGFNTVIRPVIAIDATHLKSKTRGGLLVVVCKDGNEMIYPLAFGFANSKCSKSWTWFLKQLHDVILHPELVLIVSDQHTGISNGMRAIFPNSAYVICAYHLANNLKQHCRKRGDVIYQYYHAAYANRVEKFNRVMAELKSIHPKVYDELLEVGI